jgi:quercetin dioxygenase-like cupin family protein
MKYTQSGGKTVHGPENWFTGDVLIDTVRNPDEHTAIGCAHVRFTPGARTAWHHHPKGQTLYVTDGIGYVASRGGEIREIRPGDVVFIEPGEEHWHGASADRSCPTSPCRKPTSTASRPSGATTSPIRSTAKQPTQPTKQTNNKESTLCLSQLLTPSTSSSSAPAPV